MIELATLFLGFVVGVRPVELAVDERVAAAVVYLDDREVARVATPARTAGASSLWTVEVDFGAELEPHRLEAVALDAAGRALERARRLVNYARADYGAVLVLGDADDEGRRSGRVRWAAVLDQDPWRIDLLFDDRRLPVEPDGRFVLPSHEPQESHSLQAELVFPDGHRERAELAFGGRFGERVTSALTAVPLRSPPGRPWTSGEVRGWLELAGRPVDVFAARAEEGTLLVVRDEGVDKTLRRLARKDRSAAEDASLRARSFEVTALSPRPLRSHRHTFPLVRLGRVEGEADLRRRLLEDGSWFRHERRRRRDQLWDGVALAARHAAASNRPRAVLLMAGGGAEDRGVLGPRQTLHYLASVRVPLYVWTPDAVSLARLGLAAEKRTYTGAAGLDELARRLAVELASQTIVWVEGDHLPRELTLGEAAPDGVVMVE